MEEKYELDTHICIDKVQYVFLKDGRVFMTREPANAEENACSVCKLNKTDLCSHLHHPVTMQPCHTKGNTFLWIETDPLYADLLKVKELSNER